MGCKDQLLCREKGMKQTMPYLSSPAHRDFSLNVLPPFFCRSQRASNKTITWRCCPTPSLILTLSWCSGSCRMDADPMQHCFLLSCWCRRGQTRLSSQMPWRREGPPFPPGAVPSCTHSFTVPSTAGLVFSRVYKGEVGGQQNSLN